jgi:hypothetical protein
MPTVTRTSPSAAPVVAQTLQMRGLYRLLFKRLKLPRRFVHASLSAIKRAGARDQVAHRNELAQSLPPAADRALTLEETSAFKLLQPGDLDGSVAVADRCREIFEAFQASGRGQQEISRNPNKRFLLAVLSGNEFHAYPEIVRFMVQRPLLDAVSRYLGTVPVLEGAALWWTPPNDTVMSSQAVHVDLLAQRQVKIIMNCTETTMEQGPLHFVPADVSDDLRQRAGHSRGRLGDEWLEEPRANDQLYAATGEPGSAVLFDSSRCLHFGSRGNRYDRLVLTFHYLPLDAPTETRYRLDPPLAMHADPQLDEIQRLALGFRD